MKAMLPACTAGFVLAAGITAVAMQPSAPQTRSINLVVAAKKADNSPFLAISLGDRFHIGVGNAGSEWCALADGTGSVTATLKVDTRATSLAFGPRSASSYPGVNGSAQSEFEKRLASWSQTMALPADVRVRIPNGATTVYATYQARTGTSLKGQLKRLETGIVIKEASLWAEDWMAQSDPNGFSGKFEIDGVPTAQAFWLAASWGSRTSYQQIPALAGSVEMPDWALTAADITCPLTVTVPIAAGSTAEKSGTAISFVRADGRDVFTYYIRRGIARFASVNPDGLVQSELQSPDMAPKIPSGTYYVYPDMWTDLEAPTAFIKRLRNGDTPPTTIPKFVVTSGQTATGTVDFGATQAAVVDWIRPSIEANAQSGLAQAP